MNDSPTKAESLLQLQAKSLSPSGFAKSLRAYVHAHLRAPDPALRGTYPVILYFADEAEAREFQALIQAAKPNLKSRDLT